MIIFRLYVFIKFKFAIIFDIYDFNLNQEFEDDDLMYGVKKG